jgi:twitching motility protein PilJ
VGLLGLLLTAVLAMNASSRSAAQVAAAGQARRSRSGWPSRCRRPWWAMPAAFPEVKESAGVLARNVRSLKTGEGDVPPCRALQEQVDRCCRWWTAPRRMPHWCWASRRH